ncbi:MAG TPA: glycoside hydrolase family 2 TIM barrel-domain containing protein [Solirubrobacteraceae bacterium]|nr:glycoside hydrolase family 2 TIM barrel-domain containing protein [Solirubrobacteraceae bacterium]
MHSKNAAIAVAAVCVALGASAAAAEAPPSGQSAAPTLAAQAVPGVAPSTEGPSGRTLLARWMLALDPSDRGLARGWQRGGFSGRAVTVPNDVDPTQYKGRAGQRNYEGSVAWYRTSFNASTAAIYAFAFSSANFKATAYVDGKPIASHRGSYLPFEGRAALAAGKHTLVVRIDWRDPGAQSKQGFHRTWFNWGGLNGPVSVRAIGQSELLEPSIDTSLAPDSPNAAQASVRLGVRVRNDGPTRTIAPTGTLADEAQTIAVQFPAQIVAAGATASFTTSVAVANPALWSPSKPSLYELKLEVAGESGYFARVGLRQLTWHEGRMLLNGRQLKLHGASIQEDAQGHGDALTPADQNRLIAELKAIGANAVRSQHPLDPAMLERLDAAGFVVWQGIGPVEGASEWQSSTPKLNGEAEQQARTAAIAAQLHPSIIAWNLVDEVAHNGHDAAEVSYVQTLTKWLHERDPTRMVAVDVWGDHPPVQAGTLYRGVDAVAETDYTGWYDSPQDSDSEQRALMRARLRAQERTFAGKVLIVSEFGAESNTLNASGAPGSYSFQSALLARHIAVYSADPKLSGMLVWDLNDAPLVPSFEGGSIHFKLPSVKLIEGINQKGLFTYGGAAKPAAAVVARLFRALSAG